MRFVLRFRFPPPDGKWVEQEATLPNDIEVGDTLTRSENCWRREGGSHTRWRVATVERMAKGWDGEPFARATLHPEKGEPPWPGE